MPVRQIFLILVLCCGIFAFPSPMFLGPNVEYGAFGAAAPADFRGAFVPQANVNLDFSWLEPLGADPYGTWKPNKTNYIRFLAGAEASPFYGTLRAGLGFAFLPPPFAVLEFRVLYSNENIWCDVDLPMKPGETNSSGTDIDDAWDAGYIFDRFYDRSSYSQIQSFDIQLLGRYVSSRIDLFFLFYFSLIDIRSDYDNKSFSYMRGIPLFSRDYVVSEELSAVYNLGKNFAWNGDFMAIFSGRQFKFYSPFKTYDKEPLSYSLISTGPLWKFGDGKSFISFNAGFFVRGNNSELFSDHIKERIILSVKYKHFWNFGFGK
jgi:hypothetical protein